MTATQEHFDETDVLALIEFKGDWSYYMAPVDYWVMDWDLWGEMFAKAGHPITEEEAERDVRGRAGVRVFDERSAEVVLSSIADRRLPVDMLRVWLRERQPMAHWDDVSQLFPAVMIEFSKRRLRSMYTETLEIERYVPSGWKGEYSDFYADIPETMRHWVDGATDYLSVAMATLKSLV